MPSYSFFGTVLFVEPMLDLHRYRRAGEQDLSHREIMMALRRRSMMWRKVSPWNHRTEQPIPAIRHPVRASRPMSVAGQTEKNSVRAKVFRIAPESGPCAIQSALRICARSRHVNIEFVKSISANNCRACRNADRSEKAQIHCQPWHAVDLFFGLQGESPENGSFPGFGWRLSGILAVHAHRLA
jgi:hypothetical protein